MEEIVIKDLITNCIRKKFIIVGLIVVCTIFGIFGSKKIKETSYYTGTTTILLGNDDSMNNVAEDDDMLKDEYFLKNYISLISNSEFIKEIENSSNVKINLAKLSVIRLNSSALIQISYQSENENEIYEVLNTVVDFSSKKIAEIYPTEKISKVNDLISISKVVNSPSKVKPVVLGIVVGFVLSIVYVLIFTFFDTSIKSKYDVEEKLKSKLLIFSNKKNIDSETNKLKSKILLDAENSKVITLFSNNKNVEKSTISKKLAEKIAKDNVKVLLVNAVINETEVYGEFCKNKIQTSDISKISNIVNKTDNENLYVTSVVKSSAELEKIIYSNEFKELINKLRKDFDFVFINSENISNFESIIALSKYSDKSIIVSEYGKEKMYDIQNIKQDFEELKGNLYGVILTNSIDILKY